MPQRKHFEKLSFLAEVTFEKIQKQPPEMFYIKTILLKTSQYSQEEQENTRVGVSF